MRSPFTTIFVLVLTQAQALPLYNNFVQFNSPNEQHISQYQETLTKVRLHGDEGSYDVAFIQSEDSLIALKQTDYDVQSLPLPNLFGNYDSQLQNSMITAPAFPMNLIRNQSHMAMGCINQCHESAYSFQLIEKLSQLPTFNIKIQLTDGNESSTLLGLQALNDAREFFPVVDLRYLYKLLRGDHGDH
jgi:hypothetical protein